MFNKTQNGDVFAGNKTIIEKITLKEDHKLSKRIAEEMFAIVINNFRKRIAIHKEARHEVFKLSHSDDPWWLDETDFVFEALHKVGRELDDDIQEMILQIKEISPNIYYMCRKYIDYEIDKRRVMQGYLIVPKDRNITGLSFPEKYMQVIKDLEENLEFIERETEKVCDSL